MAAPDNGKMIMLNDQICVACHRRIVGSNIYRAMPIKRHARILSAPTQEPLVPKNEQKTKEREIPTHEINMDSLRILNANINSHAGLCKFVKNAAMSFRYTTKIRADEKKLWELANIQPGAICPKVLGEFPILTSNNLVAAINFTPRKTRRLQRIIRFLHAKLQQRNYSMAPSPRYLPWLHPEHL